MTRQQGARFQNFARNVQEVLGKRGQWKAFGSVARYDKSRRPAADYHPLPLTLRNKLETPGRRAEGLLIGRLRTHQLTSGDWKVYADVFGGSGFVAKATDHLGLRGYVLDTKFGPRCDLTKLLVLT